MTEPQSPAETAGSRAWRWLRRAAVGLVGVAGIVTALVLALLVAVQVDPVSTAVAHRAVGFISHDSLRIRVDRVTGSWITGLRLTGVEVVSLSGGDTAWSASLDSASLSYHLLPLLRRTFSLEEARMDGVAARLDPGLLPEREPAENPWTVEAGHIVLALDSVAVETPHDTLPDPWTLSSGRVEVRSLTLGAGPPAAFLDTLHAGFRPPGRPPGWGRVRGSGVLEGDRMQLAGLVLHSPESDVEARGTLPLSFPGTAPPGLSLDVSLAPLHLADLAPFLPAAVADSLRLRGEAGLRSRADTLHLALTVGSNVPGGLEVEGSVTGSRDAPSVAGRLTMETLDLEGWGLTPRPLVLDGSARAETEGGALEDLRGRLTADLRLMEAGEGLAGGLELEARADSAGGPWRGDWSGTLAGARAGGSARLELAGVPSWAVEASGRWAPVGETAQEEEPPAWALAFMDGRVEARGRGFAPDSLDGRIELRVDSARTVGGAALGPGRLTATLREGEAHAEVELDAAGGRLALEARGSLPGRSGRLVRGDLRDVDVAALLGDTLSSRIRAEMEGELSGTSPLRASGTIRILDGSYGPWAVDSARVRATVRGEQVEARLSVVLPDSGRAGLRGRVTGTAGARRVEVDSLAWRSLDLRTVAAAPDGSRLPATRLTGSGQARASSGEGSWTGTATLELEPSRVGTAELTAGRTELSLEPGALEATFRMETDSAGAVEGSARIPRGSAQPTLERGELQLRSLDLGSLSGGALPRTALSGRASGSLSGADLEAARGRLQVTLGPSRVGSARLDTVDATATLEGGRFETEGRMAALQGLLTWEGRGSTEGRRSYELRGSVDRPAPEADGTALFARFGVDGTGTRLDSARVEGWVEVDSARWAGRSLSQGVARLDLRDGVLQVDTVDLTLPGAALTAGGSLPLSDGGGRQGELQASLELSSADVLRGLLGREVLSVGEAGGQVSAQGSLDDLELQGEGWASALLVNDIRVQGMELRGQAHRTAAEGWVQGQAHLMVDRMRLPTASVQRVELDATLEPDEELVVDASAVIDGRRDAELTARVEELSAPSAVRVERFTFRADQDRWTLASPARIQLQDGLQVDSLRIAADGQELRAGGTLASGNPLDFHAALDSFEISTVADLLGFPALQGRVSASLDVTGTASAPVVRSTLESRLEARRAAPAQVSGSLDYEEGAAEMEASVRLADGTGLQAEASLPVELSLESPGPDLVDARPMRLRVVADSFPVSWFEPFLDPATARELAGRLAGEAEVTGSPGAPELDGRLALEGGAARLPALGVRYGPATVRLRLQGTEIVVETARVASGPGVLTASGSVEVDRLDAPRYHMTLRPDRFRAMSTSAVQTTLSGEVEVEGEGASPTVTGDLQVERADLYLGNLTAGSAVAPVELTDEDWEELARVFGWQRPSDARRGPPFMETVTLDLQVRLSRDSWIRQRANPEMAVQFTGDFSVRKDPGEAFRLVGSVEAVPERSWVEQFGRRFSVTQGNLVFRGPPSDTRVEAQAQYSVPSRENPGEPEVALTLTVTGTPEELSLELSSTPRLEASDMVSYLVTGRPASQSLGGGGEAGSLTGAGGALALGRLSSAVEAYARQEVGLDVVEITTDGLEGVTLLAGRYLSPELYLGVRQPLSIQRSSEDPGQRAPTPEIELEFQAVRWLLLNLRAGGRGGVEFFVRSRLAYD